mgnify:CR=1 FL=1
MIIPEFIQNQLPAMAKEAPFSITVCDTKGIILYMNEKSLKTFERFGTEEQLIGTSLFNYHPPHANDKIKHMLETQDKNAYTIEKNGLKKLIYQCPWYKDGIFAGLIELSLILPDEMPHFIRK